LSFRLKREITLEIPQSETIFVDIPVRFLVPRNDKSNEMTNCTK